MYKKQLHIALSASTLIFLMTTKLLFVIVCVVALHIAATGDKTLISAMFDIFGRSRDSKIFCSGHCDGKLHVHISQSKLI